MNTIKIKKIFFWLLFFSVSFLILIIGGTGLYLFKNSDNILKEYQLKIENETGIAAQIKKLDFSLFPSPAISLSQVTARKDNFSLKIENILLKPVISELFRGNFFPAQINIFRPSVEMHVNDDLLTDYIKKFIAGLEEKKRPENTPSFSLGNIFQNDCAIEIRQGAGKIYDKNKHILHFAGFDSDTKTNSRQQSGIIKVASINLHNEKKLLGSIGDFTITGEGSLNDTAGNSKFSSRMMISVPGILSNTQADINFAGTKAGWQASFDSNGNLDIDKTILPWGLNGNISRESGAPMIKLNNINLLLDADKGNIKGALILPTSEKEAELSGVLRFSRLSLTQWFGFARNLIPGLALALDNITDADMEFSLTSKSLTVPHVSARALGFCFSGRGGVADFDKPNIYLDMESDIVNLDRAVPESIGEFHLPPIFFHPTLTPMPGEPALPGKTGIDYDINLGAKKVLYGPLTFTNGKIRITQGKMDTNGLEDVLINIAGEGYGGTLTGYCILGGAKTLPMAFAAKAGNFQAQKLLQNLPFLPMRSGTLDVSANIKGAGKELIPFLASLNGDILISARNPVWQAGNISFQLNSFSSKTRIKTAFLRQKSLGLESAWQISLSSADCNGKGNGNGLVWFGDIPGGINFKNLPMKMEISINEKLSGFKNGLKIEVSGNETFTGKKLELNKTTVSMPATTITGKVSVSSNDRNMSYQGNMQIDVENLATFIDKYFAKKVSLPSGLRSFSLGCQFSGKDKQASLSQIKGKLGTASITGKLTLDLTKNFPISTFNLNIDKIMLASANSPKSSPKKTRWDFSSLNKITAAGVISVGELWAYGLKFTRCSLPVSIQNGKLTAKSCTAIFYGANMHLDGTANFRDTPDFSGKIEVLAFNLGQAVQERKMKSLLNGYADFTAQMSAKITGPEQLLSSLEGVWSFRVKNGSWQKLAPDRKVDGKPTQISIATASGSLKNSIARSNNFFMQNSSMKIDGGGWINLQTQELDGDFEVDLKGLPNFPLHISGSLDKIKTSIGKGKFILNLLGGVMGGIIDVFANLGNSILGIFR